MTVISTGGMNRHTCDDDPDAADEELTPTAESTDVPVPVVVVIVVVELSDRHWMSALKRPGVKKITEHSWNAFSSLLRAGIRM